MSLSDDQKECAICQYRWLCPVDINGHMPCESEFKGLADDKDEAKFLLEAYRDYLAENFDQHK